MKPGDYVRYSAAWLRSGFVERHLVLKTARMIGRVEAVTLRYAEVSWPGARRPNELVGITVLEVIQEGR